MINCQAECVPLFKSSASGYYFWTWCLTWLNLLQRCAIFFVWKFRVPCTNFRTLSASLWRRNFGGLSIKGLFELEVWIISHLELFTASVVRQHEIRSFSQLRIVWWRKSKQYKRSEVQNLNELLFCCLNSCSNLIVNKVQGSTSL